MFPCTRVTAAVVFLLPAAGVICLVASSPSGPISRAEIQNGLLTEPLAFEPAADAASDEAPFVAHGGGYIALVRPDGAALLPEGDAPALTMRLDGARPGPVAGEAPLPGVVNYLLGSDPAQWRTGVPTYARVRARAVYPGIDAVYYGSGRRLEYDLEIAPGADPGQVRLAFSGASDVRLDPDGSLLLGALRQLPPVAYQERDGVRERVQCGYRLAAARPDSEVHVSFALGSYDPARPLVIDPTLTYCTRIGGTDVDDAEAVAVSPRGDAYVAGTTRSTDLLVPRPASVLQRRFGGLSDAYVACFRPTAGGVASRLFTTYLGGKGAEFGSGVGVDFAGNVYLAGTTGSADFPGVAPRALDAFVVSLTPDGRRIRYATLAGGSLNDLATGLAVDPAGNAYVAGNTSSTDFPATNGFQTSSGGKLDGFACRLDAGGVVTYSTYLGGDKDDRAWAVAADSVGGMYVCGQSASASGFGASGAFQPGLSGAGDAFVVRLNTAASGPASRIYSTYLGGAGAEAAHGIAIDAAGNAYVTGSTNAGDFPLLNPMQSANGGATDAFLTVLDPLGRNLVFSTYLGGFGGEEGRAIAVQGPDRVWLTGSTSDNFPGADPSGRHAMNEAWIAWVDIASPPAPGFHFATYLGGDENDSGSGVALAPDGSGYVCGTAFDSNGSFPATANAFQRGDANGGSGFLAVFTTALPSTPTHLTATPEFSTAQGAAVGLAWDGVNAVALAVVVERKPDLSENPGWGVIGAVSTPQSVTNDFNALPGRTYAYRVRAVSFDGPSAYSNEATATTAPLAPPAPAGLSVTHHYSGRRLTLRWTDTTTDVSDDEAGFEIERRPGADGQDAFGRVGTAGRGATSFTDGGVLPVSGYRYRVRATNVAGVSDWTPELSVITPVEKFSIGGVIRAPVAGQPLPQAVDGASVTVASADRLTTFTTPSSSGTYLADGDGVGLEPGAYTVTPTFAGLVFGSADVTVGPSRSDVDFNAVGVQLPDIRIVAPATANVAGPNVRFFITIVEPGAFTWRVLLDGEEVRHGNGNDRARIRFTQSLTTGPHNLRVIAEGVAGGPVARNETFLVDSDRPRITLFYPPASPAAVTSPVQFRGDIADDGAAGGAATHWSLSVDGTPLVSDSTDLGPQAVLTKADLPIGMHTVRLRATDGVGHVTQLRRRIRVSALGGPAGLLRLDPPDARLDAGDVSVGRPVEVRLTLRNVGDGPLNFDHDLSDVTGLSPTFWHVNQGQHDRRLDPGTSHVFRVFYDNSHGQGVHLEDFNLTSTDPSLPTLQGTLRVNVIPIP
jgi:hypothetical protein